MMRKNKKFSLKQVVVAISMLSSSLANATVLPFSLEESSKYLGIHLGTKDSGADVFSVGSDGGEPGSDNRSALGRINPTNDLPATEPGIVAPNPNPLPGKGAQTVPDARLSTFGGNIALTGSDSQFDLSDTDTYSAGVGIECANSNCVKGNSNSAFFVPDGENPDSTVPIGISPDQDDPSIRPGHGVAENVDFTPLLDEIAAVDFFVSNLEADDYTGILDLTGEGPKEGGAGYINNFNIEDSEVQQDFVLSEWVDIKDGLNIIDIQTDGNDFNINNSNFIVDGAEDSFFIFVLDNFKNMLVTNSRILAGENMGLENIMFVVNSNTNDTHINFSQSEVWGAAFWDLSSKDHDYDGSIVMNNVRGCGQWVSNELGDWNDVALDRCISQGNRYEPVSEPPSLALFALALLGLGWMRKQQKDETNL